MFTEIDFFIFQFTENRAETEVAIPLGLTCTIKGFQDAKADSVYSTPLANSPIERPADSAGELYGRTDISSEQFFQALGRARQAARDEIERLMTEHHPTSDQCSEQHDGRNGNRLGCHAGPFSALLERQQPHRQSSIAQVEQDVAPIEAGWRRLRGRLPSKFTIGSPFSRPRTANR
ncbi:hypothetical protein [Bradyrhizobium diazoefficiens]|uniref:hypothetical protein n=1 Tax=Bradyrhizobium diazoefficiens TaxID=1355477 RepID=UPI00272D658E|nr:hypothetical protein [Bradyrhizobium diazoefficiens]WLA67992.1 hypothetical protein QNN01_15740 [Bradyrhizobium diazoefficiens]